MMQEFFFLNSNTPYFYYLTLFFGLNLIQGNYIFFLTLSSYIKYFFIHFNGKTEKCKKFFFYFILCTLKKKWVPKLDFHPSYQANRFFFLLLAFQIKEFFLFFENEMAREKNFFFCPVYMFVCLSYKIQQGFIIKTQHFKIDYHYQRLMW